MPSKPFQYILFHTDACHLCELAAQLLDEIQIEYEMHDICDDDLLAEQYGIRIPVLKCTDTDKELNWPFDMGSLQEFLGA
ncbi:glutaredoxin 2 [Shewanella sediminis HAW-EB3]|uniref:Glutaredoxin 2 n=1 Tax=Shewanella sediminis (strain HAW-EB3) TaxID=425104 RepID=A8FW58_SHESH|nr:glutaredoxin family protein [Shewanella sediminis]ABV37081.1 glutaredoxin 2 [Shewanella sediminis HAW-EB3]